jgi:hypothetical protein
MEEPLQAVFVYNLKPWHTAFFFNLVQLSIIGKKRKKGHTEHGPIK